MKVFSAFHTDPLDADDIGAMVALPRNGVVTELLQTEVLHLRQLVELGYHCGTDAISGVFGPTKRHEKVGNIKLPYQALVA